VVEVKTDMGFGFPCTFPIIGPVHGKRRIYERSIDSDKLAKPGMAIRQYMSCLFLQILEDIHELLEAPRIGGLRKTALFNALFGGYLIAGEFIFFKRLRQMLR